MRFLGWPLGWALTVAAVFTSGAGPLGLALGTAGMFTGAWWSRGRLAAFAYGAAFLLAAGILKLGLLGQGALSMCVAGGLVGLLGESGRGPFDPKRCVRWGFAFGIGTFLALFPGVYLSHFGGMLGEPAGLVLGAALAGGLCGAVASFIADPDDPDR